MEDTSMEKGLVYHANFMPLPKTELPFAIAPENKSENYSSRLFGSSKNSFTPIIK